MFKVRRACFAISYCNQWRRGAVVERRTCDQEVVGSILTRAHGVKTLGKFLSHLCASVTKQYKLVWPKGGDARRLGR